MKENILIKLEQGKPASKKKTKRQMTDWKEISAKEITKD